MCGLRAINGRRTEHRWRKADARAAYLHAAIAAKRVESDELKAAEKAALERDDLDEATAIAALVKTLAVEIEGKAVVAVDSREQWSKPVNLSQGDYVVSATGRWTPKVGTPYLGPEGKIGANGLYGLFIRINGHALTGSNWGTFIGKGQTVEITEDNTVVDFVMNDPGTHDDNDGVVTVTIARVP